MAVYYRLVENVVCVKLPHNLIVFVGGIFHAPGVKLEVDGRRVPVDTHGHGTKVTGPCVVGVDAIKVHLVWCMGHYASHVGLCLLHVGCNHN